jgi:hypothetical protein
MSGGVLFEWDSLDDVQGFQKAENTARLVVASEPPLTLPLRHDASIANEADVTSILHPVQRTWLRDFRATDPA